MAIFFPYRRPWVWLAIGALAGCVASGAWMYFTDLRAIRMQLEAQTAVLQRLEARAVRPESPFETQREPLSAAFARVYENAGEGHAAAQEMGKAAAQYYLSHAREQPQRAAQELANLLQAGRLDNPAADNGSLLHAALKAGLGAGQAAASTIKSIADLGVSTDAALVKILRDGLVGAFAGIPANLPLGLLTNWIYDWMRGEQPAGAAQCCCRCDVDRNCGDPPGNGPPLAQAEWRFDSGAHLGAHLVQPSSWDQIVAKARENSRVAVLVSASTDTVGAAPYNDRLSERRAASITAMLRDRGIGKFQLFVSAHGESADGLPVTTDDNHEEARNRAVWVWLSRDPIPPAIRMANSRSP